MVRRGDEKKGFGGKEKLAEVKRKQEQFNECKDASSADNKKAQKALMGGKGKAKTLGKSLWSCPRPGTQGENRTRKKSQGTNGGIESKGS